MHRLTRWSGTVEKAAQRWGVTVVRVTLGLLFCWFAVLRMLPAGSVSQFAAAALDTMTYGAFPEMVLLAGLAMLETTIGLGLLVWWWPRTTLLLLAVHTTGSLLSLFALPGFAWVAPGWPTMAGQSALKDLLIVGVVLVLLGSLRAETAAEQDG